MYRYANSRIKIFSPYKSYNFDSHEGVGYLLFVLSETLSECHEWQEAEAKLGQTKAGKTLGFVLKKEEEKKAVGLIR